MPLSFPVVLFDGEGFEWDLSSNGSVSDGTSDAFDGGVVLGGAGSYNDSVTEDGGREVVLTGRTVGDMSIERKVYVPETEGFARYLEIVTNTGQTAQTFTVQIQTNLGSDSNTVATTSSGDDVFDAQDTWITTDDNGGSDPVVSHIISGAVGSVASASQSGDNVTYSYDLALAPGETQIVMHFVAQNGSDADATADVDDLSNLGANATDGMTQDELSQVVNFDTGFTDPPVFGLELNGNGSANILEGGNFDDTIKGFNGNDLLFGSGGDDIIMGHNGRDVLLGDEGADRMSGGAGADLLFGGPGDDIIAGDNDTTLITTANTVTTPMSGQDFSVSLTVPDAANGTTLPIEGYVSRTPVTSEILNVALVIDNSGSTSDVFNGTRNVGDLNGDGVENTILDAEIAGYTQLINGVVRRVGSDANITVVRFDDTSEVVYSGIANADGDGNGTVDAIDALRSLRSGGGTDFEEGLQPAIEYFENQGQGQNILYFLSDGENNSGTATFADEVTRLLDADGIDATVRAVGVGADASELQLDLLDDGIDNDSAQILVDPSTLGGQLVNSGITRADIARVVILVNGEVARTIPASALTQTPLGFRFEFGGTLDDLNATADDTITVRAIANNAAGTVVATTQVVEHLGAAIGNDTLVGGDGDDIMNGGGGADVLAGANGNDRMSGDAGLDRMFGGSGSDIMSGGAGNDTLKGGGGADQMRGNGGSDLYFVDNAGDSVTEFRNEGRDTVRSSVDFDLGANIENLTMTGVGRVDGSGNGLANTIVGNSVANDLSGLGGNDTIRGGGGSDVLDGGNGRDLLFGGAGADQFVFRSGDGNDTVRDFNGSQGHGDRIDLSGVQSITGFNDLVNNHLSQSGGNTVINQQNGNTITLQNVNSGDLTSDDFIF